MLCVCGRDKESRVRWMDVTNPISSPVASMLRRGDAGVEARDQIPPFGRVQCRRN